MVTLCVCTRHIPPYTMLYRHMGVRIPDVERRRPGRDPMTHLEPVESLDLSYVWYIQYYPCHMTYRFIYLTYICNTSGTLPTFDIEGRTFDILILRYRRCNLRYRRSKNDHRYRVRYYNSISKVWHSISNASTLRNVYIEGCNIRYRTSTISKNPRYRSLELRYRRNTISKKRRYRRSERRYCYIPISKISRYR